MARIMPNDQVDHFLRSCVTVQFLIDDLRIVSDYVGCSSIEEMNNYYWFRQHFDSGFTLPRMHASGRAGNNESESNLGYNIRSIVQDIGLGLGDKSKGWGVDLWSQRVANVMSMDNDFDFSKNAKYPMRGEHVEQAVDLRNIVREQTLVTNLFGSIQETAEYFATNHLFAVVLVEEDRKSGTQTKISEHSHRQPFRRYVKAGSSILMYTGIKGPNSVINVTHFTTSQIFDIRKENPRWKNLITGIRNHNGFDDSYLESCRSNFHSERIGKKSFRASSYYPKLTKRNLDIIARNDPVELCQEFYTWKIK